MLVVPHLKGPRHATTTPRLLPVRRLPAAALLAGAAVLAAAPAARAHVSVNPGTAEPGAFAAQSFRVPNERDDASTVRLDVVFPADHPLAFVSVQPVPGWTAQVHRRKLETPITTEEGTVTETVASIVWKGGTVAPGEFQEFPVSLGPVPKDTDQLVFKAVQTYSDGEVVRWITPQQDGAPEPEHPAPVLTVQPAPPPPVPGTTAGAAQHPDIPARVLGGAGLLAALAAAGWTLATLRRRGAPRPTPAQPTPEEAGEPGEQPETRGEEPETSTVPA